LNRLSEVIEPFQMMTPSRRKRTFEPRVMTPGPHVAPGDGTDARHPEDLADLSLTRDDLFELRSEQADHGPLDVLDDLVDDLVGPDLHALGVGHLPSLAVRADVEADDRGVGRGGQRDVVLGDAADGAVHERRLDVSRSSLRRLSVRASSEPCTSALSTRLSVATSPFWIWVKMSSSLTPFWTRASPRWFFTGPLLAGLGDGAGGLLVRGGAELVAGVRAPTRGRAPAPASTDRPP
jgi:hypothetical protein